MLERVTPPDDFFFPEGAGALIAAQAQMRLYASPDWCSLYPYFATLETRFQELCNKFAPEWNLRQLRSMLRLAPRFQRNRLGAEPRLSADILMVGECHRQNEIMMMVRLLRGVLSMGFRVIYLVSFGSAEHHAISELAGNLGRQGQLRLVDPYCSRGRYEHIVNRARADFLARSDFLKIVENLPSDIGLRSDTRSAIHGVSMAKLIWDDLTAHLDFRIACLRNHFDVFSSAVAVQCLQQKKPIVTFQHGIVSTKGGFLPIVASRQVCFGKSSSLLLQRSERELNESAGRSGYCKTFVLGGSLVDEIQPRHQNFEEATVLLIDQENLWAKNFYGIEHEFECMALLMEDILRTSSIVKSVVVRLHPDNQKANRWYRLKDAYPGKFDISLAGLSLQNDLKRAAVVIGLFSGAMVSAAASGIPVLFVWQPGWYYTPDLGCFFQDSFIPPTLLLERIEQMLLNRDCYQEACAAAIKASGHYYFRRQTQTFEGDFISELFSALV